MSDVVHSQRATPKQAAYLKALYRGAGLPFKSPCCSAHASGEIAALIVRGVKPVASPAGRGYRKMQKRSHNHRARKARR